MLILVADDVEDVREVLRSLLELLGHDVMLAANGLQAVQLASRQPPDVVLMDLSMPVMDGITATRALRELAVTSRVPIVLVSAHLPDSSWRARALEAGCNDCYSKPLDPDVLGSILAQFEARA